MTKSSRALARTWGYPRHRRFVAKVRKAATEWFEARQYPVNSRYPYILSDWEDWHRNMIVAEVAEYIHSAADTQRDQGLNFPLHKYIHHGLSSQAMLFNLIGPLLVHGNLQPLQDVLVSKNIDWPGEGSTAMFEYEDRSIFNEDSGQPTSIDLAILDADRQPKIFIESKFVEQEFGGCSVFAAGDCDGQNPNDDLQMCYLHHIGRRYWSLMQKYQIDLGPIGVDAVCIMTNYYQFFREILFAFEHDGIFVLLCDERSPVFYSSGPKGSRGVMPFLVGLLPEGLRQYVSYVTVQELLKTIRLTTHHAWVDEFEKKYGLV